MQEGEPELNALSDKIEYLNNNLVYYQISDRPVPIQLANSYMVLVLRELIEIELELKKAYNLGGIKREVHKQNDLLWSYERTAIEILNFHDEIHRVFEDLFSLFYMNGIRITFSMIHLRQAAELYNYAKEYC